MQSARTILAIFLVVAKYGDAGVSPFDDDYYTDYYNEIAPNATKPPEPVKDMHFQVACSSNYMTMTYLPSLLPKELGIVTSERLEDKGTSCVLLVHGDEYSTYRVLKSCHKLVVRDGSFSRHSLQLSETTFSGATEIYTVSLECESASNSGEIQIFEHRIAGENCNEIACPYGTKCLEEKYIDGYFCVCSGDQQTCQASCPPNHYGCRRMTSSMSDKNTQRLKCINDKWLCNYRFDCELEDDEKPCRETWSEWGEWSKCDTKCGEGEGHRARTRECGVTFVADPERCRLPQNPRGCERECTQNSETETDRGPCRAANCPNVKCMRSRMVVSIPKEPGMTSENVQRHMVVGNDDDCKPSDNETHVILTIPLHRCGTVSTIDGSSVVYESRATYNSDTDTPAIITRDLGRMYTARCRYERRGKVTLEQQRPGPKMSVEVAALSFEDSRDSNWAGLQGRDMRQLASGDGEFEFRMDLYKNNSFTARYTSNDYPLHKHLRERIFVSVNFQTEDEDLRVLIDRCTATPTANGDSGGEYVFLENRCPIDPTVQFYSFSQTNNRRDSFSIEAFRFSDPKLRFVYLQCDVIVCDVDDKACGRVCDKNDDGKARSKRNAETNAFATGHVMQGPIVIEDKSVAEWKEVDIDTQDEDATTTNLYYVMIAGLSSLFVGIIIGVFTRKKENPAVHV